MSNTAASSRQQHQKDSNQHGSDAAAQRAQAEHAAVDIQH
jgi:hypothetical protein